VPPLRERTEDIPLLCDYFLDKFRQRYQKNVKTLAPSVYHLLISESLARERAGARERHRACRARDEGERNCGGRPARVDSRGVDYLNRFRHSGAPTLAEIEKMAILQTLQRTNWNKQEAAQILGLYRPTLYSKMKKARHSRRRKSGAGPGRPAVRDAGGRFVDRFPSDFYAHGPSYDRRATFRRETRRAVGSDPARNSLIRRSARLSMLAHNL